MKLFYNHYPNNRRISILAYAVEQQWWTFRMNEHSDVQKKWNVIDVINIQKWYSLFSKACHYVALFQKFVDTPVYGRSSLSALTVSIRSRLLFPTLCGSINTKSMQITDRVGQNLRISNKYGSVALKQWPNPTIKS
jgi:hypothetical protein